MTASWKLSSEFHPKQRIHKIDPLKTHQRFHIHVYPSLSKFSGLHESPVQASRLSRQIFHQLVEPCNLETTNSDRCLGPAMCGERKGLQKEVKKEAQKEAKGHRKNQKKWTRSLPEEVRAILRQFEPKIPMNT